MGIVVNELSSGHHIRSVERNKQEKSALNAGTYETGGPWKMRLRAEAAGESGQGSRERVQKYPCRTCSGTTCVYHSIVIGIINRMFRPRHQRVFCSCAGAKRFVEQTQKKGVSELSATRACLSPSRAPPRNPFGERNIPDFEILDATPVNAEAVFAGE